MKPALTFVILSRDNDTLKELRHALGSHTNASLLTSSEDEDQMYAEIIRLRPSAAIVTIDRADDRWATLVGRLAKDCPTTAVICTSRNSSPDLILSSLRAGAREFLRLPIIVEEFTTVLNRIAEFVAAQAAPAKQRGRVIGVFSGKGGCGSSFIAANLAVAQKAPTVLVDLNLQSGDMELLLGLRPRFSIADVVENRDRLDDALLASYLTPHSENLSLLAAPKAAESAEAIESKHIFEIMELLRERFEVVVIDTPHTFDGVTLTALDQADSILIVMTLEIPAIRSAQRTLEIFDRLGYPRKKVRVVINRWSKQVDLDLQKVERFLGEKIIGFVPSDYRAVVNSINLGQPLVTSAPSSKVAQDLKRLAAKLGHNEFEEAEPEPRRRVFGSFFRRDPMFSSIDMGPALSSVSFDKA